MKKTFAIVCFSCLFDIYTNGHTQSQTHIYQPLLLWYFDSFGRDSFRIFYLSTSENDCCDQQLQLQTRLVSSFSKKNWFTIYKPKLYKCFTEYLNNLFMYIINIWNKPNFQKKLIQTDSSNTTITIIEYSGKMKWVS